MSRAPSVTSSEGIGSGFSRTDHFNPSHDVILRVEVITQFQHKVLLAIAYLTIAASLAVGGALIGLGTAKDDAIVSSKWLSLWVVVVGPILLVAIGTVLYYFCRGVVLASQEGKHWALRRRRVVTSTFVLLVTQTINLIFWWISNMNWFIGGFHFDQFSIWSAFIKWSCWNTLFLMFLVEGHDLVAWTNGQGGLKKTWLARVCCVSGLSSWLVGTPGLRERPRALIMDAPRRIHLPKLILWLIMEICIVLHIPYGYLDYNGSILRKGNHGNTVCSGSTLRYVIDAGCCAIMLTYMILYARVIKHGLHFVRTAPYNEYKLANLLLRLQVRKNYPVLWFVSLDLAIIPLATFTTSCITYMGLWLSVPIYMMMTSIIAISGLHFMPVRPHADDVILQVWLQDFAWAEDSKPERLSSRGGCGSHHQERLRKEPMFCFETALKTFYLTGLVYDQAGDDSNRKKKKPLRSKVMAMDLYDLNCLEEFCDPKSDAKVLIGWKYDMIVLSFRGTASIRNLLNDLKAWMTIHPPRRRRGLLGGTPKVHTGFLACWELSGFKKVVMGHINSLLEAGDVDRSKLRVLVTGHSLGGALATLAAFDIAKAFCPASLSVYTFGAPRTGNHAFAEEYGETVPDTWHIINDRDAVTRYGKFIFYKRPGQRVLIDSRGEIIVRPSFMEMRLQLLAHIGFGLGCKFGSQMKHHLLNTYRLSLVAICHAQFTEKGFKGGADGMRAMARCNELLQRVLREEELGHQFLESRGDEQLASVSRRRLGAEGLESSSSEYSRDDITGEEGLEWSKESTESVVMIPVDGYPEELAEG